jgi:hypothetical protein
MLIQHSFVACAQFMLGALLAGAISVRAEASILRPNFAMGDDPLGLGSEWNASPDAAAGQASGSAGQHSEPRASEGHPHRPADHTFNDLPISGGSSSSSSPTTFGGGSGGSVAIVARSTLNLEDHSPATRLAISRDVLLPTPPGAELLRPPRLAM